MKKFLVVDQDSLIQDHADKLFDDVLDITLQHGVCFIRFTREDGMVVIDPRYNAKINGIIADA